MAIHQASSTARAVDGPNGDWVEDALPRPLYPFVASDLVSGVAKATPAATALIAPCGSMTYAELVRRSGRLAAYLRSLGVGPESLVAIRLERSFDQIVTALAVWKAGGAFLPLDPAWPDARLRLIVADAGCAVVVGRDDTAARIEDGDPPVIALDWDTLPLSGMPVDQPATPIAPDHLAYVIYTSGSTGAPKGVEITHANLSNLIAWHCAAFDVTAADRAAHLAGLGFDAAIWEIWPYLCVGGAVSLVDDDVRTSGARLREWLIEQRISIAFAPTALAEQLIDMDWPAETALRRLLTGADTLRRRPRPGLPFALVNNYGPTECTVVATSAVISPGADDDRLPPIGRPIDNSQIHILDEAGRPLSAGQTGEIYIGGANVGRGYRGRPDLTAERFHPDPFNDAPGARLYRTGDRGALLDDGQIAYHGRIDDQVKVRGHRVEPEEIASALCRHPAVGAGTVVARADADGGMQLAAYVVPTESVTAEELREFLADALPDYMVPSAFLRLDALPLTANGKVDKAALPAPDADNGLTTTGFSAPETPAQRRLAEILATVLGHGPVGLDDNFFLLGGHSLLGTQVVLRAGEAFGVDLTLRHLFQAPTIRQLAALIEELLFSLLDAMSEDEAQQRAAG